MVGVYESGAAAAAAAQKGKGETRVAATPVKKPLRVAAGTGSAAKKASGYGYTCVLARALALSLSLPLSKQLTWAGRLCAAGRWRRHPPCHGLTATKSSACRQTVCAALSVCMCTFSLRSDRMR